MHKNFITKNNVGCKWLTTKNVSKLILLNIRNRLTRLLWYANQSHFWKQICLFKSLGVFLLKFPSCV